MTRFARSVIPGAMRHCFEIEQATETRSASGEPSRSWSRFVQAWGQLSPKTGGEFVAGEQVAADATHEVWMRWVDGVTPKMRLRLDSRVFEIAQALDLDGTGKWMKLLVKESL